METADAYNSVFDAVRSIDPSSPLIQLGAPNARFFTRTNDYQLIDMQDGIPSYLFSTMRSFMTGWKIDVEKAAGLYSNVRNAAV